MQWLSVYLTHRAEDARVVAQGGRKSRWSAELGKTRSLKRVQRSFHAEV